jgi:ADP-ribose pyrophosphatase YjhB (NUDIX family)
MHHIQNEILVSLAGRTPLRFTELKPPTVPNNTFSYHLKRMIETGYITADSDGYSPTRKALKVIEYITNTKERKHRQPKMITMILLYNKKGETLLLKRSSQPFKEWYGVPSGLVHEGEDLDQAAKRELKEKTALSDIKLTFAGTLDFRYINPETKDIFVHAVSFIYKGQVLDDKQNLITTNGTIRDLLWSDINHKDILPEVSKAMEIAEKKDVGVQSFKFNEPDIISK